MVRVVAVVSGCGQAERARRGRGPSRLSRLEHRQEEAAQHADRQAEAGDEHARLHREGDERQDDGDLLGAGVFAVVLLLIPLAVDSSVLVSVLGGLIGAVAGLVLAVLRPR